MMDCMNMYRTSYPSLTTDAESDIVSFPNEDELDTNSFYLDVLGEP